MAGRLEKELLEKLADGSLSLGPKIRDAAKEELRIRKANRAVARAVEEMAARDRATPLDQPLAPIPTVNGQTPFDRLVAVGTSNWQKRIAKIDPHIASEDERRAFYELAFRVVWLEPPIRREIAKKLIGKGKKYQAKVMQGAYGST
jgi:hypothetical protein